MRYMYHMNLHIRYILDHNQVHLVLDHPNFQNMASKAHNCDIQFHIDHKQFDIQAFQAAGYLLFFQLQSLPCMIKIW